LIALRKVMRGVLREVYGRAFYYLLIAAASRLGCLALAL